MKLSVKREIADRYLHLKHALYCYISPWEHKNSYLPEIAQFLAHREDEHGVLSLSTNNPSTQKRQHMSSHKSGMGYIKVMTTGKTSCITASAAAF